MSVQTKLPGIENEIRNRVKNGIFKIDVARELGISYHKVKKCTKDIRTTPRISKELEQRIRYEVKNGKTKRQVATDLNICRDTVRKYTRDIKIIPIIIRKRSLEEIKQIREKVKKYNSKIETARKMGLTYNTIRWYTRDILIRRGLSSEEKEKIRREMKNGKTKRQLSKELDIPYWRLINNTRDIVNYPRNADISFKAFVLLQELMDKGYAFPCSKYGLKEYQILRMKFSNVCRARIYGKSIFYFKEKSDIAAKEFIRSLKKRVMSYQKFSQISKLFQTDFNGAEKNKYLHSRKYEGSLKDKKTKRPRPLENDDSCINFYLRNYRVSYSLK